MEEMKYIGSVRMGRNVYYVIQKEGLDELKNWKKSTKGKQFGPMWEQELSQKT